MGRPVGIIVACLLLLLPLSYVAYTQAPEPARQEPLLDAEGPKHEKVSKGELLPVRSVGGRHYFSVRDLMTLGIQVKVDGEMGTITLQEGECTLRMLRDAPVLSRNHRYLPVEATPLWENERDVWVPVEVVQAGLGRPVQVEGAEAVVGKPSTEVAAFAAEPVFAHRGLSADEMVEYLSFLASPIPGGRVSNQWSHLPGAIRAYRNGVHEGLDYYTGASGRVIDRKTSVVAAADGIIVRIDHDYVEMSEQERNQWLEIAARHDGQTPSFIFDKMRGRSVWIQHEKGVLTRYVHLDRISPYLQLGDRVKQGDRLGYVGNSGTRDGVKGNDQGLHLHFDILIEEDWFWRNYSPQERMRILREVLDR
jgi:murein DD-endopeptidase MepM/ murein hydrolase activator NlpD